MAKVLFIQDLLYEFMGPMYLAGYLKKEGHKVDLIVLNENKNFIEYIKKSKPDLIAFSIISTTHQQAFKVAEEIKKNFRIPIVFGGSHPTFFPEMMKYPFVDIICIGEGEEALAELADKIDKKKPYTKIKNLWVKENGRIHKNPIRKFVENLDKLPFPDRELYYSKYPFLAKLTTKRFLATRGCPYNCTFCFNHILKEMYEGKGSYLRRRTADNILKEIKDIRKKYPLKVVRFIDDSFTLNKNWLFELLTKFKKEINLPFTCQIRANEVDEELIKKLKDTGCIGVSFGVESGNEKIRNLVLCKNLTNKQIIECAGLLRKYKIDFGTSNMMCLPGETLEDAFETIKLNAKIKPNNPVCAIFQPYPKTKLAEYAIRQGLLDKDYDVENVGTIFGRTPLKIKNAKQFINLQKFFMIGVLFPWTIPLIRVLIKLPNNFIFDIIYKISYGIRAFKSYKVNIFQALQLGYKLRSRFKEPEKIKR